MLEFVIRRTDSPWFDLSYDAFPAVLRPNSIPSRPVAGWGDHRIEVEECEISFSDEIVGIQVSFECDTFNESLAWQIIREVCQNVVEAMGQPAEVVSISGNRPVSWQLPPIDG